MDLEQLIRVARGDEPADLVLTGGRLVNVFSGEVYPTGIAVAGGVIAGLGDGYAARRTVDLGGRYVCPGFIDAHVHIESAMVRPSEFARAVTPHGVTTVITDPHEIANVAGLDGIRFMLRDSEDAPLSVLVNVPSCVPATAMETSGATLDADRLCELLDEPRVLGLAEVMDYPGVVAGAPQVLKKIDAFRGRVIDGHAPGLGGQALNAYLASGVSTDHECTGLDEALEKLRLGAYVLIREASASQNLAALIPMVRPENERRICFCTDDRTPHDLLTDGSIDHLIRLAIAAGVDPISAIRMATLNTADAYGLHDRGAVAPGRRADLVVFETLEAPRPEQVFVRGECVHPRTTETTRAPVPNAFVDSVRVDWSKVDLRVPVAGRRLRVIGVVPGQIVTQALTMDATERDGEAVADPDRDLLKMAVLERHHASGGMARGFVTGMGLRRGALAGTVAHDHHNLVVIGADDRSMMTAARHVASAGGGLAAADGDRVLASLSLPVAGLMSDRPIEEVRDADELLLAAARGLGSQLDDPYMQMSFLTLEVIPSLKLTDVGLVDVDRFEVVDIWTAEE